jgi:di/tricarboxylate transporter
LEVAMTLFEQRQWLRIGHLVASALLGAFIYSPLQDHPVLIATIQFIAFPTLALSGVWMWQQGRVSRLRRARAS